MELPTYDTAIRPELVPFLPAISPRRVLDIGSGPGGFGIPLRQRYPTAELVAVEPEASQAEAARARFDVVHEGFFPVALPDDDQSFDLIVINDVIEHVVDPWELVESIKAWLSPAGLLFAAIPNVRHLPTSAGLLLRGRWTYTDWGILDRTHLRFFARETVEQLFDSTGWEVLDLHQAGPPWLGRPRYAPLRLVPKRFADPLHKHFVVVARPAR